MTTHPTPTPATAPKGESTHLPARDGYALAATIYRSHAPRLGRIVLAGATGVPQGFYRRFATFAAEAGFDVWTFDYRGIGRSRQGSLAGFSASFLDWGQRDLAGIIDAIPDEDLPLYLVAHSFGGHALGMLPNHDRLRAAWISGVGAGWLGWNPPGERVRLWFLWNLFFPPLVQLRGYMPMSLLGMGEDLPRDVYRQWRHWCSFRHYFLDDPAVPELREACATVKLPILGSAALDDRWAGPASRDAFLVKAFPHATLELDDVDPARAGGEISHMGYFRASAEPLWREALAWLQRH